MLDAWSYLGGYFGAGFARLLLQLPAAQVHGWWGFQTAPRACEKEAM
jgi:hypothetical protein